MLTCDQYFHILLQGEK